MNSAYSGLKKPTIPSHHAPKVALAKLMDTLKSEGKSPTMIGVFAGDYLGNFPVHPVETKLIQMTAQDMLDQPLKNADLCYGTALGTPDMVKGMNHLYQFLTGASDAWLASHDALFSSSGSNALAMIELWAKFQGYQDVALLVPDYSTYASMSEQIGNQVTSIQKSDLDSPQHIAAQFKPGQKVRLRYCPSGNPGGEQASETQIASLIQTLYNTTQAPVIVETDDPYTRISKPVGQMGFSPEKLEAELKQRGLEDGVQYLHLVHYSPSKTFRPSLIRGAVTYVAKPLSAIIFPFVQYLNLGPGNVFSRKQIANLATLTHEELSDLLAHKSKEIRARFETAVRHNHDPRIKINPLEVGMFTCVELFTKTGAKVDTKALVQLLTKTPLEKDGKLFVLGLTEVGENRIRVGLGDDPALLETLMTLLPVALDLYETTSNA